MTNDQQNDKVKNIVFEEYIVDVESHNFKD